jgi:hypothetical protein
MVAWRMFSHENSAFFVPSNKKKLLHKYEQIPYKIGDEATFKGDT